MQLNRNSILYTLCTHLDMKKLIIALSTIGFALSLTGVTFAVSATIGELRVLPGRVDHYKTDEGSEVRHYDVPEITVIRPKSFDILFDGQGSNATNVVKEHSYNAVINASYFGRHDDGTYFPAGVRYDNGFLINAQTIPQKDINLQVLAYYNQNKIQFLDNNAVDLSTITQNTPGLYFNA